MNNQKSTRVGGSGKIFTLTQPHCRPRQCPPGREPAGCPRRARGRKAGDESHLEARDGSSIAARSVPAAHADAPGTTQAAATHSPVRRAQRLTIVALYPFVIFVQRLPRDALLARPGGPLCTLRSAAAGCSCRRLQPSCKVERPEVDWTLASHAYHARLRRGRTLA